MGRISRLIPSFFNGVSQQVPALRLQTQCEKMINAYPSLVTGVRTRPPLKHVARISDITDQDCYIHIINRDAQERYIVVITDGCIEVYDLEGNPMDVYSDYSLDYLMSDSPSSDFSVLTVADHTFIVNKTVEIEMDETEVEEMKPYRALVWVKKGVQNTSYSVVINNSTFSIVTDDAAANYRTTSIAASLKTAIDAALSGSGFTVSQNGSVLKIDASTEFTFSVGDSYGNQALEGIKGETQKFDDLPNRCWSDVRVKVIDNNGTPTIGYYVEFDGSDTGGVWRESRGWNQSNVLDKATMPWELVREADGTFTFQPIEWEDRYVGDDDSCPLPSFVGHTINDMIFHRNRLGFVSDENVIFSRAGDFFNFFPETTLEVRDGDPIDTGVSHRKVSIIRHTVPFENILLLFADQTQFILASDTMLSPKDVKIDVSTEYECSLQAKPVGAGSNVYFATPMGDFSGILEYYVAEDGITHDASNITAHVPNFIPSGIFKLISSANEELLLAVTDSDPHKVFVYKYYWVGNEKVQSSWGEWEFPEDCYVRNGEIIDTRIYFVVECNDGLHIMYTDFQGNLSDPGFDYEICLDKRCEVLGVYNRTTDTTTWTLPYEEETDVKFTVILGEGFSGRAGSGISNTLHPTESTVTAVGDYSTDICYIGIPYEMRIGISQQFIKQDAEEKKSIIGGRLQLMDMTIYYSQAYTFNCEVTAEGRGTNVYSMKGRIGTIARKIGTPVVDSGSFRFPILSRSDKVSIDIVANSYIPCAFQSAEWSGQFVLNSKRM
jgi:hypothetical protein